MTVVAGLLGLGRRFGRTQMTSTVRVERTTGKTRDPATGRVVEATTVIYDGPAEVVFTEAKPRDIDAAGQRVAEQLPLVKFPNDGEHAAAAAAIRKDDMGVITASEHDPGNIGTRFRVTGIHAKSNATSRRLPVEVLSYA